MKRFLLNYSPGRALATAGVLSGLILGFNTTAFGQGTGPLEQALAAYDAAITADSLTPVTKLTTPVVLTGAAGSEFDFGQTSGDATFEFILQGDPVATGASGFLAVGELGTSSLRYEQWNNTQRLGFTQGGVADYLFNPSIPSPTSPTHVAYVWSPDTLTMSLYINGELAGTAENVTDTFIMPTGAGWLGSNPTAGELMFGTIHRATIYDEALAEDALQRHAEGFAGFLAEIVSFTSSRETILTGESATLQWQVENATAVFLNNTNVTTLTNVTVSPPVTTTYTLVASNALGTASSRLTLPVDPPLGPYDAAIAADVAAGLTPLASLTNALTLTGTAAEPFDFGANSGDVSIEFVLEGDPVATGDSGYLAVGENSTSNLRYDQWQNTMALGFTQLGVADYMFIPGVPSPTIATHVTFVWDSTALTMQVYVNGVLAGTATGVTDAFAMPTGAGYLGATAGNAEAMVGRIHRVHVYDDILPEAAIKRHADAFTSVIRPPIISSFTATPSEILGQGSSVLQWAVENASAVFLDNAPVTGTNQTVTPTSTTTYTLIASNNIAAVTANVTISVTPLLEAYDAAIAADTASGLTPLVLLTNAVTLTGGAGVPFDFGPNSGDVTMEFILEGDPVATGDSGYLAVGETPTSNLRYDQWQNTGQMGFTQLGVADYLFTPEVASPTVPTHVTYVWNATDFSMTLYLNGVSAGTSTGVSDAFVMPAGPGFLGANPTGGEPTVGRIFRIAVYDDILPEATIVRHANAFAGAQSGPSLSLDLSGATPALTVEGTPGAHYRVEYIDTIGAAGGWQLLQDIPSLSGTSMQVVDTTPAAGQAQRFYRIVQL